MKGTDVIVVGAGISGMMVANRLAMRGLPVRLLEAGIAPIQKLPSHPRAFEKAIVPKLSLNEKQWPYQTQGRSYRWQRVRSVGGRSLLWGGWCLRPEVQNFRDAVYKKTPWPLQLEQLNPYLDIAETILGVQVGGVGASLKKAGKRLGKTFLPKRTALHPSGRRPLNAVDLFRSRSHMEVTTGAVALEVLTSLKNGKPKAEAIEYYDIISGSKKIVRAQQIVICASALETARLLLSSHAIMRPGIGRGLTDHLLCSGIVVCPGLLSPPADIHRWKTVSGYIPRWSLDWPFVVEVHGPLPLIELPAVDLLALGISLSDARQGSYYAIHAIGEAQRHRLRRLSLYEQEKGEVLKRDFFGRIVPTVHWAWGRDDLKLAGIMQNAVDDIAAALAPSGAEFFPTWNPLVPGGISHEAGTCSMGVDHDSVTDSFGRVRGVDGLTLADASVMPSALDKHPTLTVLALALRCADQVLNPD